MARLLERGWVYLALVVAVTAFASGFANGRLEATPPTVVEACGNDSGCAYVPDGCGEGVGCFRTKCTEGACPNPDGGPDYCWYCDPDGVLPPP